MSEEQYREISGFLSLARDHFGGLVKVQYPQIVDVLHLHHAEQAVIDAAHKIDEPVLLSMGEIERFYDPEHKDWLPAIDVVKQKVLDADDLKFATTMSGARAVAPQYLLDVNFGRDTRAAELKVQELRAKGLRSIKGDWAGAQDAPEIDYLHNTP